MITTEGRLYNEDVICCSKRPYDYRLINAVIGVMKWDYYAQREFKKLFSSKVFSAVFLSSAKVPREKLIGGFNQSSFDFRVSPFNVELLYATIHLKKGFLG